MPYDVSRENPIRDRNLGNHIRRFHDEGHPMFEELCTSKYCHVNVTNEHYAKLKVQDNLESQANVERQQPCLQEALF